jgi:HK97 family phage prohead protease
MNELTRETADAVLVRADDAPDDPDAGRHVRLRIMPWDVVANPKDTGPESFVRGAFDGIDATRVVIESGRHDGQLVGRGESLEELDDAAYLDTVIARTAAGDELLELARAGVYRDVSVAFAPVKDRRRGGVTERVRADLRRVAIVPRGTYPGAEVVHVRTEEEQTVTEQTIPAAPSLDDIGALVRGIVADAIPAPVVSIPAPDSASSVLLRASSFGDLYQRVLDGDDELLRALADELTSDVPEIVRPAWLSEVLGILPATRPVVTAFGRDPLPPDGMEVNWPTFAGATDNPALRVAPQSAEKADIVSAKITLDSAKASVVTYAGGLDISWQTLKRSSPSFREIALRILTTAWAQVTDKAFAAAIEATATGTGAFPATPDADAVHLTLVQASAAVDDATGSPATFVLAGADAWLGIAGVPGLFPKQSNMYNSSGSVDAAGLQLNVSGLPIIRAKGLSPTAVIVSNGSAASWLEDGMFTAAQDVVAKLGTDVAVWSLGAPAVFIPSGIVELTGTPALPFAASSGRSSRKSAE